MGCFRESDNKFFVVGIVSFSFSKNCLVPPSVYQRVSQYTKWIKKQSTKN